MGNDRTAELVNYASSADGWESTQIPAVADDGEVPPAILAALQVAQHSTNASARGEAAALVRRFLGSVCDDLAGHRLASMANRAELDRLRHLVYGPALDEAGRTHDRFTERKRRPA